MLNFEPRYKGFDKSIFAIAQGPNNTDQSESILSHQGRVYSHLQVGEGQRMYKG